MSVPLKLGAEPKKVAILGGLLLVAAGIYVWGPSGGEKPVAKAAPAPVAAPPAASARQAIQAPRQAVETETEPAKDGAAAAGKAASRDFKPSMKRRPGENTDPEKLDPTLRTDLLARLAGVHTDRVERSLFDFTSGAAVPKVKLPEPKIVIKPVRRMIGPALPPPPPPQPVAAVKPPPPPIPLKFFGRALPRRTGVRRVFCIVNDEVAIPSEGDVLQKRYKIQHITATTVVVEDLNFSHEQTLPIEEPAQGGL
ncbi:MAG: hypothetical protein P4K98_04045 [Bryobacteraceae bacterium]|nr:hypothetical protein [Bryobacteraceae bacterium]